MAPLFETESELIHCGEVMADLLKTKVYQRHLIGRRNHQFVMLGYSASSKETGTVSSHWLLRRAQEALVRVADEAKVDLTIFHGRGNTSSRNAGMVETLTRTMPDGAARGRVRMTEQGELIHDKYSLRPVAAYLAVRGRAARCAGLNRLSMRLACRRLACGRLNRSHRSGVR